MDELRVIDMWAPIVPTREVLRHMADHFPDRMLGYLRVFFKQAPTKAAFRAHAQAIELGEAEVLAALDAAGVGRCLITGFDERSSCGETFIPNELVAPLAERHPDRFIAFAGADVFRGVEAVREVEHFVRDRGFRGLSLRPFMIGLPADDPHYYPFYAKCIELDIPLSIHTSANWTTVAPSDLGHPRHIDQVAADFPELRIVMSHAGYPWVLEAVLLAWKYPNVYLELAAHRPKYLALLRFGATTVRDKVLFGSGWFLLGRPLADIVAEFRELPLAPAVLDRWLWGNAEALLGR
jgi:predicted TIM-barrel fold metal-dependent hydrolase